MNSVPRAAYVHVPFCRHRCGYCDFPLVTGRDELIDDYLAALEIELRTLKTSQEVDTLFFGGGTPTHLPPNDLRRMLSLVRNWLPLAEGGEFSVEANPNDLGSERVAVLIEAGVNRVSLGVQSLQAETLTVLERDHSAADVTTAINQLRNQGIGNVSVDLIFGVPGQSLDDWQATLITIGTLVDVEHLSTYGLTYEKGTAFWKRRATGQLLPAHEETERQMYALAMDLLPQCGFGQYEISNFARPGFECRHNQVYWRGEAYYAFGPGAARYLDGIRSTNHRSVTTWLNRILSGESGIAESEHLNDEARARELIMLGLRMTAGIDLQRFENQTGFDLHALGGDAIDQYCNSGLLELSDGRMRLTREGRFLADSVTAAFL